MNENREVEMRAPWRVQVNYTCAPERGDDEGVDAVNAQVELLNKYAEKIGLHVEFGYILPLEREAVIPGSDVDIILLESARPSFVPDSMQEPEPEEAPE